MKLELGSKLVRRILLGIFILLVFFSVVASYIGYVSFRDSMEKEFIDSSFRTAQTGRVLVKAGRLDEFLKTGGKSGEYKRERRGLDILCNKQEVTFVYVIKPDEDYKNITFVFSTAHKDSGYDNFDIGHRQETSSAEYEKAYKALYEKKSERETIFRKEEDTSTGAHITSMVPVKDGKGEVKGILCVQRQMDEVYIARNAYMRRIFGLFVFLTLLVVFGQGLYLNRSLFAPILKITREAGRFARENKKAEVPVSDGLNKNDEIGDLASAIDKMEAEVDDYIANLAEVTSREERASTELNIASRIQEGMLPNIYPAFPDRKEFDIYAEMHTAKEVGGDFYDFFLIDDDHLAVIMADVSGKGVPAALFMMASKILLDNIAASSGLTPAGILKMANDQISAGNKAEMFVTVWLGILDIKTGELTAANAGHEYPAIKRAGGKYELYKDKHGFVVGGMEGISYKDYTIKMNAGDELFVYTDGVTEATDTEDRLFGTDRMLESLNRDIDARPDTMLKDMKKDIDAFAGEAVQFDDITMLAMRYNGTEGENMNEPGVREITVTASEERFNDVMAFVEGELEKAGCPVKKMMPIEVAVEEIFVNIANYAYPDGFGKATVRTRIPEGKDRIEITFMDHGTPYDPLAREDPDTGLSADDREIGGLGIYMVKMSMDKCSYEYKDGMNIFTIIKNF